MLAAGHGVVVDAVHQRPDERDAIDEVARAAAASISSALWLEAPVDALARRVEARRGDASDATADVVHWQAGRDPGPLDWTVIESSGSPDEVLARAVGRL